MIPKSFVVIKVPGLEWLAVWHFERIIVLTKKAMEKDQQYQVDPEKITKDTYSSECLPNGMVPSRLQDEQDQILYFSLLLWPLCYTL